MSDTKKVALVTGASRGIGAAIAAQLSQDGFFVVGTATSQQGAESISQSLATQGADCGVGKVLNVCDKDAIEQVISEIEAEYGNVLVLVNNAGQYAS